MFGFGKKSKFGVWVSDDTDYSRYVEPEDVPYALVKFCMKMGKKPYDTDSIHIRL